MTEAVASAASLLHGPERLNDLSRAALRFASQHRGAAMRMGERIALLAG